MSGRTFARISSSHPDTRAYLTAAAAVTCTAAASASASPTTRT